MVELAKKEFQRAVLRARASMVHLFPFMEWGRKITKESLRADLIAGVTVALVLVPQSIAYAQLAGLPPQYGLYAAFLPPMIAALFGSSKQLATGPVAIVSLITAGALVSFKVDDPSILISYAVMLSVLVGAIQVALGFLRMGVIVNFISHPVIMGFSNAAALIIASSQLPKIFGVSVPNYEHHYETVYHLVLFLTRDIHWMSVGMAVLAAVLMIYLKWLNPKAPIILITVIITTLLSWVGGFEQRMLVPAGAIQVNEVMGMLESFNATLSDVKEKKKALIAQQQGRNELMRREKVSSLMLIDADSSINRTIFELEELENGKKLLQDRLKSLRFYARRGDQDTLLFTSADGIKEDERGRAWRLKVGESPIELSAIELVSGGSVVGNVPQGLPAISIPKLELGSLSKLLNPALVIALLGFMQSISIARSLAAKTKERINPNQELLGQGMANLVGSLTRSYPVSGSFSMSTVNFQAGAQTGIAGVFTSGFVLVTLLFLTPLLYYLPQPVLAVIIVMSVVGLVKFDKIAEAWRTHRSDGVIAIVTFMSTLFFAPDLDRGIMLGVIMSTGYYIYRRSWPRIVLMSRGGGSSWHDVNFYGAPECRHIMIVRFEGSLFFANAAYLESRILSRVASQSRSLKYVVLVASGINYIDYSGIETLMAIHEGVEESKKRLVLVDVKSMVLEEMQRSGLYRRIGEMNIFRTKHEAIEAIYDTAHRGSEERHCPLVGFKSKE